MAMIALVGLLALFNGGNASKALTERSHWADNSTGLAIGGFDPVAYFAVARAVRGREGIEHGWNGGGWRFVNDGNRRAFARDPEVYAPRFGGLDPVLLARGRRVPGNPRIWMIRDGRLYLFYSAATRQTFATAGDAVLQRAAAGEPDRPRPASASRGR